MNNRWYKQVRVALVLTALAAGFIFSQCGPPPPTQEELWQAALSGRPSTYGLTLPEPVQIPEFTPDSSINPKIVEEVVPLTLRIDDHGAVVDVQADLPEHFFYVLRYDEYLRSIRFEPGFRDTMRVAVSLPVVMQVEDVGDSPGLLFPVYPNGEIVEYDLYAKALEMNGLTLPSIKHYPSYYCDIDSFSTAPIYPWILYQLDLDSTGDPTAIEPFRSTYPEYEQKVRMATNWGEYTPLEVGGVPRACRCYLLVSFFPLISYPTVPIDFDALDSLPLMERLRVRMFPDTLGLMAKPIPRGFWQDTVRANRDWHRHYDRFSMRFEIDSLGKAHLLKVTGRKTWNRQLGRILAEKVGFYPALDFHGRPHDYSGPIHLERKPKLPVRMWITWLPESKFELDF